MDYLQINLKERIITSYILCYLHHILTSCGINPYFLLKYDRIFEILINSSLFLHGLEPLHDLFPVRKYDFLIFKELDEARVTEHFSFPDTLLPGTGYSP